MLGAVLILIMPCSRKHEVFSSWETNIPRHIYFRSFQIKLREKIKGLEITE